MTNTLSHRGHLETCSLQLLNQSNYTFHFHIRIVSTMSTPAADVKCIFLRARTSSADQAGLQDHAGYSTSLSKLLKRLPEACLMSNQGLLGLFWGPSSWGSWGPLCRFLYVLDVIGSSHGLQCDSYIFGSLASDKGLRMSGLQNCFWKL
jgi:hypothetical protein